MAYYGTYAKVATLFGSVGLPNSSYWTQSKIETDVLTWIYDEINMQLAAYYYIPFDDTTYHDSVPPMINNLAAEAARIFIMEIDYRDKKPNKTPLTETFQKAVSELLLKLKLISKSGEMYELVYSDGTIVTRKTTKPVDPNRAVMGWHSWAVDIDDDGNDDTDYMTETSSG